MGDRQYYFDSDGKIHLEKRSKKELVMTEEEVQAYEELVMDSSQMTIFDYLTELD